MDGNTAIPIISLAVAFAAVAWNVYAGGKTARKDELSKMQTMMQARIDLISTQCSTAEAKHRKCEADLRDLRYQFRRLSAQYTFLLEAEVRRNGGMGVIVPPYVGVVDDPPDDAPAKG